MIITFCGHSDYIERPGDEEKILSILGEKVGDGFAELYFGDYGRFDHFARACGEKYQKTHPNTKLIFISPYINRGFDKKEFDGIIYPELERVPLRFAIVHRNRWMAERADIVIACVTRSFGGAYETYTHAKRKKKEIFNIGNENI